VVVPQAAQTGLVVRVWRLPNCPACDEVAPEVIRLYRAGYPILFADWLTNQESARSWEVTVLPTVILERDYRPVSRLDWPFTGASMETWLKANGVVPKPD
jgi:hypothetical protein